MLNSMVCKFEDFSSGWYADIEAKLDLRRIYAQHSAAAHDFVNRKFWEWCVITQALEERGRLQPGMRGLGFAVGTEPLSAYFASCGAEVLATDLDTSTSNEEWISTGQHAAAKGALFQPSLVSQRDFDDRVSFQPADMRTLEGLEHGYDFLWSSCAFEHLGSLRSGLDFVIASAKLLKPGGVAVHTTEFNVNSDDVTVSEGWNVVYRRRDILKLRDDLAAQGYRLIEPNFDTGDHEYDRDYDTAPFMSGDKRHIKLELEGHVSTSMLIVIENLSPPLTDERKSGDTLLARRSRPIIVDEEPSFSLPDSQMVTSNQIYNPDFVRWSQYYGGPALDRKLWEYCYIAQAISTYVDLGVERRGLVFGSGKEKLPAILASAGHKITATDLPGQNHDWQTESLNDIFHQDLIDEQTFRENVSFRSVDMNNIPADLCGYDFLWSTGSLEHIGSHANGLAFIENAMRCLKPGGVAVHTTEFTISSEDVGQDHPELSFYSRSDIEALATRLLSSGHQIVLNFRRGQTVADYHADTPPYERGLGLAAHFFGHIITSIGLIVQKSCI